MGLAMPDEFLPHDGAGEAAAAPASAPGRLILRVEGQAEADAFLAAYAVEQPSGEPQQPPSGAQLPSACAACGATAVGGFAAAARQPVASFIRSCFIVSAACSSCSARAVEVRSSGGVSAQGCRLRCAGVGWLAVQCAALAWRCGDACEAAWQTEMCWRISVLRLLPPSPPVGFRLRVEEPADLERAVLQSASASIAVPELELVRAGRGDNGCAAVGRDAGCSA